MKPQTSVYQRLRFENLDNVELLSATDYKKNFPLHSHETFCISLIEKGTFNENELFATHGAICITNPFEIHTNKLINETGYSFKTFYLSPYILQYSNQQKPVFFSQKVIIDLPLFAAFREIAQIIEKKNRPLIPDNLLLDQLGKLVSLYSHSNQLTPAFEKDHCLFEVKMYIKDKLHQKISLDEIAAIAAMDKFKFIRFFKRNTGLSPFSYIILQRIEKSKTLLKRGNPVIDAALDAGFYDQSHFSNYFKHYVGVTPIAYQAGCNILQE